MKDGKQTRKKEQKRKSKKERKEGKERRERKKEGKKEKKSKKGREKERKEKKKERKKEREEERKKSRVSSALSARRLLGESPPCHREIYSPGTSRGFACTEQFGPFPDSVPHSTLGESLTLLFVVPGAQSYCYC